MTDLEEYTHKFVLVNRDLFQSISGYWGKYKTITSKLVREGQGRRAQTRLSYLSSWAEKISTESESLDVWEERERGNAYQGLG